ncbi:MAG: FecCD family ABC transporter permease [Thermomicrobiales bacterium]
MTRGAPGAPRVSPILLCSGLAIALVVAVVLSVGIGAVRISPRQVVAIVLDHAGIQTQIAYTAQQDSVVWAIRLPRVLLAIMVGAGLAVSGAALQGVFRNPLADPGLIGVSSGAALGAVIALGLSITWFGIATTPLFAFVGGVITAVIGYGLARHNGRTEVITLVLAGVALNTFAGAGTSLVTFIANDAQLRAIIFWSMGSLGSATWESVAAAFPFILIGMIASFWWGKPLNLMVLGEREARHLGVDTERVRRTVILLTALMTGATVAVAGIIAFVGLIIPHLVRLVAGPDHRTLLPASALAGALLIVVADLFARTVVSPLELPLGVLTALIGGPFLLFLMLRTRKSQGGWA